MSFLFKKVRVSLQTRGKIMNYFGYALGEIILVVIGILIALQVNNWNEDRKDKATESEFYCKLLSDFELDRQNIKRLYQESENKIAVSKQLLLELNEKKKDKNYLINAYIKALRTNAFIPSKATMTDILSSGRLNLLNNDSLKNNLIRYYAKLDNLLIQLELNRNKSLEKAFLYDDNIQFGYHYADYAKQSLGDEIMDILPTNNWQYDNKSPYYKQFQNDLVFFVVMSEREKQHFDSILVAMEPTFVQLQKACEVNKQD